MGIREKQVISLYRMDEKITRVHDGHSLRPSGRLAKFQQKLWDWGIKKGLIVPSYREATEVTRVVIDGHDLFDRIYEHYCDVFTRLDPKMVIIGPNTWCDLMRRNELRDYIGDPINMTATGEQRLSSGHRRMFDLPVQVVPQMEGCVIL